MWLLALLVGCFTLLHVEVVTQMELKTLSSFSQMEANQVTQMSLDSSASSRAWLGVPNQSQLEHEYGGANNSLRNLTLCPVNSADSYGHIHPGNQLSTLQVYGYGTLAVLVISLCSAAGMLYLPMLHWSAYRHVITGFIAFGLGVMIGDAVLHLIPEALFIDRTSKEEIYMWRSVMVMGTVYALFSFETLMELVHNHGEDETHRCPRRHSHSHIPFPEDLNHSRKVPKSSSPTLYSSSDISGLPSGVSDIDSIEMGLDANRERKVAFHLEPRFGTPSSQGGFCSGWKTLALVIILGDTIHNFGDGLSVGAAFTNGAKSGLSTSLAIFCHELPHEFGDFVILMSTGLSFRQALLVNLGSAVTAFAGLYVGITIADNESARKWIFAFTAGTFLYIAIGDMLPELRNHNKNICIFLVQNICMALGMGLMVIVTMYEHSLYMFA